MLNYHVVAAFLYRENVLVSLTETTLLHRANLLQSVAADGSARRVGKDENGLKREITGPFFQFKFWNSASWTQRKNENILWSAVAAS